MIIRPLPASVYHIEGSPVDISCEATGTPVPNVEWIHKGQVESSGSQTARLTLRTANRNDAGRYTCRATNSAGNTTKQLYLVVNCKYAVSKSLISAF